MRVAIASRYRRRIGGAEAYLDAVIPALARAGFALSYICESDEGRDQSPINVPEAAPVWRVDSHDVESMRQLRGWHPDVIYAHGFNDCALDAMMLQIAPVVFFAHDYYGVCISGSKTHCAPQPKPCSVRFGPRCLAHYYPHRCGGLNPATMWRLYVRSRRRLDVLRRCAFLITASEYMRIEYLRHGFPSENVRVLRSPITRADESSDASSATMNEADELRLLFAGRMVKLKGGALLIDVLPSIVNTLQRPVKLVFAGDGPERPAWEQHARSIRSGDSRIAIEFRGWLTGASLVETLDRSHVLVMPSLWPEPFGRSGPEAGLYGVPTAAFAVGGIPEWLHDGVNGHLARADSCAPESLAEAIVQCVRDPAHHAQLSAGARACSSKYALCTHIEQLKGIFAQAAGS